MLFEDKFGRIMHEDEVDELSPWEIEELQLHMVQEDIRSYT